MISRVAESCYWLNRYIERAETMARVVSVNRFTVLDADIYDADRWQPVVVVAGEQERFESVLGKKAYNNDSASEEYLTWSEENPVSIRSSLFWARENARMTREVISREMWETVNTWWQWFNNSTARKEYRRDRVQFYQRIRSMCAEFQGVCHNTMLHEEPFDFMRLGMLLERANQTARLMDVKHYWLTGRKTRSGLESPQESAQWLALLRLSAGAEPFLKRHRVAPTGTSVTAFLLQDRAFPRAILHCVERTSNFLQRIEKTAKCRSGSESSRLVQALLARVKNVNANELALAGLHEELTHVIDTCTAIGAQLQLDFFDPSTRS